MPTHSMDVMSTREINWWRSEILMDRLNGRAHGMITTLSGLQMLNQSVNLAILEMMEPFICQSRNFINIMQSQPFVKYETIILSQVSIFQIMAILLGS